MSVKIGGKSFETLDDKIYVGGHKVTKIYAGRKLVYPVREEEPVVERYLFRFWVKWPEAFETGYGPSFVNSVGHYYTVSKDDPPIYRAAIWHDSSSPPYFRIYFTNVDFVAYGRLIEAIGFAAIDDEIVYDLYTAPFNYFTLVAIRHAGTGRIYYTYNISTSGIRFNATVPGGAYATDVYPNHEWGGILNGVPVVSFTDQTQALNYVLGIS